MPIPKKAKVKVAVKPNTNASSPKKTTAKQKGAKYFNNQTVFGTQGHMVNSAVDPVQLQFVRPAGKHRNPSHQSVTTATKSAKNAGPGPFAAKG